MGISKFTIATVPFWIGTLAGQTISGPSVPTLAAYDQVITGVMARYGIPAAQLAVTRNGKLVFAHGYGTLDPGGQAPVQPDSLFRVASLSKQLTAVTILRLWDQGLIDLDKSAFSYLPDLQPPGGKQEDPRIAKITVRNLLQHSGGWDSAKSGDPMDQAVAIAQALGKASPPSSADIVRVVLGRPLDFDPGTRYAYSNFGYTVLGRIIERVTGMNYEQYVRAKVLAPLGIERMRTGNTLLSGRIPGEVAYVSPGNTRSVFPYGAQSVPWPYGGWYLEAMDSYAGWVASAPDLLKFWNAIDGRRGGPLLSAVALAQMTARPSIPDWANTTDWYGMGFHIVPTAAGAHWWHDGLLDGTRSLAVRQDSGFNWAVLFDKSGNTNFLTDTDSGLWNTLAKITAWPAGDLYPSFATPATNRPAIQTQDGVVNGASFQRGFTAGSWVTALGVNLANTTRTWSSADFQGNALPVSLDGVSVNIGGLPAAVYYVSPTQLNVQVPSGLAPGATAVEVIRDGLSSGPALGELRPSAPALFTYAAAGELFAAAVFPDGAAVGDPATIPGARIAKPGDQLWLYGSNFDTAPSGTLIRTAEPLASLPVIKIGGVAAQVLYAGLVGAGLYQINVVVPDSAHGDQSVALTYGGVASENTAVVSFRK